MKLETRRHGADLYRSFAWIPSASAAAANVRVEDVSCLGGRASIAINSPTAHADTKHTTSPIENSFCQFQRIELIEPDMTVQSNQ
jgi:hypothetical protein